LKAARAIGHGQVNIEEIPVPEISDNEVMVEVKYCGICGTDLHSFLPAGTYMGHEFSGIVTKIGASVEGWHPGDRVAVFPNSHCDHCWACQHGFWSCCEHQMDSTIGVFTDKVLPGAFAKFVRVPLPQIRLYSLPNEVSFEEGALVEPLSCSLHAVRTSTFKVGDYAMVLGAGPIGLGVTAFLKYGGAGLIIVIETNKKRAEVAKSLGADYVFNPLDSADLRDQVLSLTDGLGVHQVFECSGVRNAFRSAPTYLRARGQLMLVSVIQEETPFVPFSLQAHEFQIQASWCTNDEFPMVIDFLKKGVLPVSKIITSKIKLSDIQEKGFQRLLKPGYDEIKILVSPDE
jgi:(R,R)-butanediol dehydrogenase / meso-butanediol dehydrogenase / diacetyl reductase